MGQAPVYQTSNVKYHFSKIKQSVSINNSVVLKAELYMIWAIL